MDDLKRAMDIWLSVLPDTDLPHTRLERCIALSDDGEVYSVGWLMWYLDEDGGGRSSFDIWGRGGTLLEACLAAEKLSKELELALSQPIDW